MPPQKEASKTGQASCKADESSGGAAIPADWPLSGTQDTPCRTEGDPKSAPRGTPHRTQGKAHWAEGRPSNTNRRTPCCRGARNDRRRNHRLRFTNKGGLWNQGEVREAAVVKSCQCPTRFLVG